MRVTPVTPGHGSRSWWRAARRLMPSLATVAFLLAGLAPAALADACCRFAFETVTELPDEGTPRGIVGSPDGRFLYQALSKDEAASGGVRVLRVNTRNGTLRRVETVTHVAATPGFTTGLDISVERVAMSPDGGHLYAIHTNYDSTTDFALDVFQRDARRGTLQFVQRVAGITRARVIAFSPSGLNLYLAGTYYPPAGGPGVGQLQAYRRNARTGELALLETYTGITNLAAIQALAVSPDGRNLYSAGSGDAVLAFDRDGATGLLSSPRSVSEPDGLAGPVALLLDGSGRDLYVASASDAALTRFRRDADTGDLSFQQSLSPADIPGLNASGLPPLSLPEDMALDAGGGVLYVLDGTQLHGFVRDPVDGSLRFVESQVSGFSGLGEVLVKEVSEGTRASLVAAPVGGRLFYSSGRLLGSFRDTGPAPSPRLLAAGGSVVQDELVEGDSVPALSDARAIDVSPDARHVYVANSPSGAGATLSVFQVDAGTGAYRPVVSYNSDDPPGGTGIGVITAITVSGDGRNVYAVGDDSGVLTVLARDPVDGTLSAVQSLSQGGDDGHGHMVEGLAIASAVRVSPDGANVYVLGMTQVTVDPDATEHGESTVAVFGRDPVSGELTFEQVVVDDLEVDDDIHITNPYDLAFTPDGRFAYVGAGGRYSLYSGTNHALFLFAREADGTLSPVASLANDFQRFSSLAVSPDGRNLYGLANLDFGLTRLAVFAIDRDTGMPTLEAVLRDGAAGVRGISGESSSGRVRVSADGKYVIVSGGVPSAGAASFAVLARDAKSGGLTALDGRDESELGLSSVRDFVIAPGRLALHIIDPKAAALRTVELPARPVLVAPSDEDTLAGADVRFRWDFFDTRPGTVRLQIGSAPGLADLFNRSFGRGSRQARVKDLPLDGNMIHVSLSSGNGPAYETTFTAASPPAPALVEPAAGANLPPGRVTFAWTGNGQPVTRWELLIGSTEGGDDLYSRRFGARSRSARVSKLPEDGRELFVTLRATVGGEVLESATTHTAAIPAPKLARDGDSGFRWTDDGGADEYLLQVGSAPGGGDLCDSGPLAPGVLAFDCASLPGDGRDLFVTLTRTVGEITTRHTLDLVAPPPTPVILEPAPGSTLAGHTAVFSLDRRAQPVSAWELRLGTRKGGSDIFREKLSGEIAQVTVPRLPTVGGVAVFARLYYTVDGRRRFSDFQYASADFPLPALPTPNSGPRLTGAPITFLWQNNLHDVVSWRLDFGTEPGAVDFRSIRSDEDNDANVSVNPSTGQVQTTLSVAGLPADTTVYARLSYRIAGESADRFEDRVLTPASSACCAAAVLGSLVDSAGGVSGFESSTGMSLAVSPDGAHVYVVGEKRVVVILARDTDEESPDFGRLTYLGTVGFTEFNGNLAVSPDGAFVYASASTRTHVYARETDPESPDFGMLTALASVTVPGGNGLAFAPGGTHLYVAGNNGGASVLSVLAIAGDGTLTLETSVADDGGVADSLAGPVGVVALPVDGDADAVDVYVAARFDNALTVLRHDRGTGSVSQTQAFVDDGIDPVNGVAGLNFPVGVLAAPDGGFVYVQGTFDQAIAVFQRDPATGVLTYRDDLLLESPDAPYAASSLNTRTLALSPDGSRLWGLNGSSQIVALERDPGTGEIGDFTAFGLTNSKVEVESQGVGNGQALVISPDGRNLYLARRGASGDLDAGVSTYRIDAGEPDLTSQESYDATAGQALVFDGTVKEGAGGIDGLQDVRDMALSPGGRHLYVVSGESKLAVLETDPDTGALTQVQVLRQDDAGLSGLLSPQAVLVSPDGAFVYVATTGNAVGVMIFARDTGDGTLSYVASAHSTHASRFQHLAMSADGRHLYATYGSSSELLAAFARDAASGRLTEVAEYREGVEVSGALDAADDVLVSRDGRNVYVISRFTDTVASFARDGDSGALSFVGVAHDGVDGMENLDGPDAIAESADGKDVYVLALFDRTVTRFQRRAGDGLLVYRDALVLDSGLGLSSITDMAYDASADQLYVSGISAAVILTRQAGSGALATGPVVQNFKASRLLVAPDGTSVITARSDTVQVGRYGPRLVTPAPGAALATQTVTFTWNANGVPAGHWRLLVGSAPGAKDHCDSRPLPKAARSFTCSGLPRQGKTVFATLVADTAPGREETGVASYTAASLNLPALASPVAGEAVSGSQAFTLDARGNDIVDWRIRAGTSPGSRNLFNARLPGDATGFTIDGLPADADVFVSVEARGTFGRQTTVYQYNPPTDVRPWYPRNGARWGEYVRAGDDVLGGSDRSCSSGTKGDRAACVHGGEHRVFVVPGQLSCDGVSATDALDAFDWTCSEEMMPVRVVSTGLKAGHHLSDLLDFDALVFGDNAVTVSHGGTTVSDATAWWDNPVEPADDGGALTGQGTVYLTRTAQPLEPFVIPRRRGVSLVVEPGVTVTQAVTPGDALVRLDRADFAWVEGSFDAAGASFGVQADRGAWTVMDGVTVSGADTPAARDFAGVATAGVALDRARNALLRETGTDLTGDAGVVLTRATGSRLWDVHASRAGVGVSLDAASGNVLEGIVVAANDNEGLALDGRSRDNVVVELTASNNFGDGVVVAGRSDGNRLIQVLARHNGGSGVLVDGSLGTLLQGVTALDNSLGGISLVGARRGVLASLALGNNGSDGLALQAARDNLVMDVASADNDGAGVALSQGAVRNVFRGELRVGNNGDAGDCVADDGSSELATGCTMTGASDAVVTTDVTLESAFVGISLSDAVNDAGTPVFEDVADWSSFENPWRGWGPHPIDAERGPCGPGQMCVIRDTRLLDADTGAGGSPALADVLPLPAPDDQLDVRMRRRERFLPFARELLADGIGDDDGLCEAGEDCLAMPHLGAFQGEGGLDGAGTTANGVRLFRHQTLVSPATPD